MELFDGFQILNDIPLDDLEEECQTIKEVFLDARKTVLGHGTKTRKELITEHSWKFIKERPAIKRLLDCRVEDKDAMAQEYGENNVAVKQCTRHDKRVYVDELATEAQAAAERGETTCTTSPRCLQARRPTQSSRRERPE